MILTVILLLAGTQTAASPQSAPPQERCDYDPKTLTLGLDAFDQDMTGGWRALSMKPGCEEAAANMIRAYRLNLENYVPLLYWHEAQLRASADDYATAIPLMERSREPADNDKYGWNAYVDATIAFLRNDQPALTTARNRLATLVKPSTVNARRAWPPNLNVVDGLIRCFGKPYKVAYGPTCRPPKS